MAETCIVCLGDLDGSNADVAPPPPTAAAHEPPGASDSHPAKSSRKLRSQASGQTRDEEGWIAHLLPCGHNLHNECLKPWVERANSCPICRTSFNMVELSALLGGPVISSYAVQDKKQEADIDPSMIIDDDLNLDPCMICEEYGDTAELMLCDGCSVSCHIYCAGLDRIPDGPWYCHECARPSSSYRGMGNGTSTAHRRMRRTNGANPLTARDAYAWARVWRTVFDRLGMDLDFPFDDASHDGETSDVTRREHDEWERRAQIAARQGAGQRFRQTVPALLEHMPATSRPRPRPPPPESQEEIRAWNAFEKAKQELAAMEAGVTPSRRKRKSVSSSPSEPDPEPAGRPLKRPRTMGVQSAGPVTGATTDEAVAESSRAAAGNRRPTTRDDNAAPSFLQSLLSEVEKVPSGRTSSSVPELPPMPEGASSPNPSSPAGSPSPMGSNIPTPRATTPPPLNIGRPLSPIIAHPLSPPPLTSSVVPIFPSMANNQGLFSPGGGEADSERQPRRQHRPSHRSPNVSPPRSKDGSPGRERLSYSTKSEIQRMVTSALKPRYIKKEIDKDQYTDINMNVSRLMYDIIGDAEGLAEEATRKKWQQVAEEEVEKAINRTVGKGQTEAAKPEAVNVEGTVDIPTRIKNEDAVESAKPEVKQEPIDEPGPVNAQPVQPTAAS